jgi:hypothetical protein
VAHQLVGGVRVGVEHAHFLDAQQRMEGQRLELALRAVADQREAARIGPRQRLAAMAEVAAVRSAVVSVSSDSSTG